MITKKLLICTVIMLFCAHVFAQKNNVHVKIETPQGWCIVKLYNQTPIHRDNFIKLAKKGYFNTTTFNRIIKDFVIQGGDQDSLYEKYRVLRPEQKWLSAELDTALYHKRGAVAMGRDDNPSQASFATQFYIVDGRKWTDEQLDAVGKKYNIHFTSMQRKVYRETGGTPHLDQHYTVLGEIVKGLELIDKITAVGVDKNGNPDTLIWIKVTVLQPKEVARILQKTE